MRYPAKCTDIPSFMAAISIKLIGIKRPRKNRKAERVKALNLMSLKGSRNTESSNFLGCGGSLDRTVNIATVMSARTRKAHIRMAHPKPTCGMRCEAMIGKMIPPKPDPAAMTPYAAPLFLKNHVGTELAPALKMQFNPRGLQTPCARINW